MQGSAGPSLAEAENIASWAHAALEEMMHLPDVCRVGLGLTEGGGRRLLFTASDRDPRGGVEWCLVDAYDDVPLNSAVRSGQPVLGALDGLEARYPGFVARQQETAAVALAAVPVVTAGHVLGGFVLFFDSPQVFDGEQSRELVRTGENLGAELRRVQRDATQDRASWAVEALPSGAVAAVRAFAHDPASVPEARRYLRRTLQGWDIDDDTTETAALCLSELVTNAVTHAGAGCALRVLLDRDVLTVSVRNAGHHDAAVGTHDDPWRVHGRGLQVVEALASRWGCDLGISSTTVWFDLELTGADSS